MNLEGVDELEYRFTDSSVPPPHHRSFTITVSAKTIRKVVDSYGDVISDDTKDGSPEALSEALRAFERAKLALQDEPSDAEGCTGGTTERVTLSRGGEEVFDASVYHCGGQDFGTLKGDVAAFKSALQKMSPGGPRPTSTPPEDEDPQE